MRRATVTMRWHHAVMRMLFLLATGALVAAMPAAAQLRPLVEPPASAAVAQGAGVAVFLINEGAIDLPAIGPAELDTVAKDGTPLRLVAAPDGAPIVRAGSFVRLQYRLAVQRVAADAPVAPSAVAESVTVASRGESRGLLGRFTTHEPTYGVFGLQDAGAKLQLSFAFRALGRDDGPRLTLAYTQSMLWAIDQPSGPIVPTTYSPEVFVDVPLSESLLVGGGYRHDSNGAGPLHSIDANRIFARATKSFDLGGGWRADVTPQAWFYLGPQGVAPDLDRYWGYTALTASVGKQDGIKLAAMLRGNPGTGKGAGELFLSYPLTRLGLPGVYLLAQGFTGYGEALSTYDRRDRHVRLGIAFTR
ncbi:phospholipase A [Sphingomonas sp. PB4P5]|uniref:phospholipase A n=1 Tax=Parasphingomonas puruogangriensis TaxID=3096155 RepID=UPI002FC74589